MRRRPAGTNLSSAVRLGLAAARAAALESGLLPAAAAACTPVAGGLYVEPVAARGRGRQRLVSAGAGCTHAPPTSRHRPVHAHTRMRSRPHVQTRCRPAAQASRAQPAGRLTQQAAHRQRRRRQDGEVNVQPVAQQRVGLQLRRRGPALQRGHAQKGRGQDHAGGLACSRGRGLQHARGDGRGGRRASAGRMMNTQ